jgi:hypothetical protein
VCPRGRTSGVAATDCVVCPPRAVAPLTGMAACLDCHDPRAIVNDDVTHCICPAGMYVAFVFCPLLNYHLFCVWLSDTYSLYIHLARQVWSFFVF